jgi:hypothetical protein
MLNQSKPSRAANPGVRKDVLNMYIEPNDIIRMYGGYRMKLHPMIKLDRYGKVTDESTAQVSVYDLSQRLPLVWSINLQIKAAHAAMKLFESIGYFDIVI